MTLWQSYVAGCDPTKKDSRFLITNFVVNAESRVTAFGWTPNYEKYPNPWTGTTNVYIVEGKTNLADVMWHSPTNSGTRFYRVKVGLP